MSDARKKKSGFFVWLVMALLVMGLLGFGLTGAFRRSGNSTVATVGGEEITARAFVDALKRDLDRASQQSGQNITFAQARVRGLDQASLRRQLTLAALFDEAARLNLSVGDAALRAALLKTPAFLGADGAFSEAAYDLVLNRRHMTRSQFEALQRKEETRALIGKAISGGIGPQKTAARVRMDYIGEKRDITWAEIDASVLPAPTPAPDEAAIQAYYDAHPDAFTTPETRKITYAMLTPDMLADAVEVSDAEIQQAFDARKAQLDTPERRVLDRIVFASPEQAADAMARINSGAASFEDIAAERTLSAKEYTLGTVRRTQLSKAAGALVFASPETGVYGPVESSLGPAIFRVNAVLPGKTVTLAEMRDSIRAELALEKAKTLMLAKISHLDDLVAGGASVEDLANETEAALFTIDYNSASTEDITKDPAFVKEAKAAAVGEDRDLIDLANGGVLLLRVDDIIPATLQSLDAVHDQAAAGALAEATRKQVQAYADELAAQVAAGADLSATLAAIGVTAQTATAVTRRTAPPSGISPHIRQALFSQGEGEAKAYPTAGGALVLQVNTVTAFDPDTPDGQKFLAQAATTFSDNVASDLYVYYASAILGSTDVKVNQGMIDQILGNAAGGAGQ